MSMEYTVDDLRMIRLQEGDSSAFDELMAEWHRPVLRFFQRNLRDDHLAEDFTQETLLRLYRRAWDYLPTGRFRGYLFRIAHNLLVDHIRHAAGRTRPRSLRMADEVVENCQSPDEHVADIELRRLLQEVLRHLPQEQRIAVTLHYLDRKAVSEVAVAMAAPVPTTKGRLRMAKRKLQASLSRHGYALASPEPD